MRKYVISAAFAAAMVWGSTALAQNAEVADDPVLVAGPNEAIVYFVRPRRVGGAINFWGFVDEIPIGVTRARDYIAGVVPAGEHVVWARSGNVSAIRMTLEPGQTYYIDMEVRMGALRGRVNLEVLDEEEGLEGVEDCDYKMLTDEGRERAAEILATDYEQAVAEAQTL